MPIQRWDVLWRSEEYVKVKDVNGPYVTHADHERVVKVLVDKLKLAGATLKQVPGASPDPLGIDAALKEARLTDLKRGTVMEEKADV